MRTRFSRITRYDGLLLLGVLVLLTTAIGVWRHYTPAPIGDQWDGGIGAYMRLQNGDAWGAFFAQHNEHRLAFPRILFFIDTRLFGGVNVSLLIDNLILAGLLGFTIYRIALHYDVYTNAQRRGLAGVVLLFAFSWMQNENFTWGFQNQWFAVYLFALCAFHAVDLCAEAVAARDVGRANGWLVAALVAAVFAAYSMSSGVLVFPVLLVQGWYRRLSLARIGSMLVVGGLTWFAYFVDWHAPASSGSLSAALREHPIGILRYALLYLGSPAEQVKLGSVGAFICGAIVLVTLAYSAVRMVAGRGEQVKATALFAIAVFICGNAFLTASGRLWFGLGTAFASRYTTASLTCWLALALFVWINARTPIGKRTTLVLLAVAVVMLVYAQHAATRSSYEETYARKVAVLALRSHVYDATLTQPVYPFPDALIATSKAAEAARLSIFAVPLDHAQPPSGSTSACDGAIDLITPTTTPGISMARGWIYDPATRSVPDALVITDANGSRLGSGITGGVRDDVRHVRGRAANLSGWTAFFAGNARTPIRVLGKTGEARYCAIKP